MYDGKLLEIEIFSLTPLDDISLQPVYVVKSYRVFFVIYLFYYSLL